MNDFGAERRAIANCVVRFSRAQICVSSESIAQREQSGLWTPFWREIVVLGCANSPQQHGITREAGIQCRGRQRYARLLNRYPAYRPLRKLKRVIVSFGDDPQHPDCLGCYFWTNTVSWQD